MFREPRLLCGIQLQAQPRGYLLRDRVLHRENVSQLEIELIGPKRPAVTYAKKIDHDPQTIVSPLNASFKHRVCIQLPGRGECVCIFGHVAPYSAGGPDDQLAGLTDPS